MEIIVITNMCILCVWCSRRIQSPLLQPAHRKSITRCIAIRWWRPTWWLRRRLPARHSDWQTNHYIVCKQTRARREYKIYAWHCRKTKLLWGKVETLNDETQCSVELDGCSKKWQHYFINFTSVFVYCYLRKKFCWWSAFHLNKHTA